MVTECHSVTVRGVSTRVHLHNYYGNAIAGKNGIFYMNVDRIIIIPSVVLSISLYGMGMVFISNFAYYTYYNIYTYLQIITFLCATND